MFKLPWTKKEVQNAVEKLEQISIPKLEQLAIPTKEPNSIPTKEPSSIPDDMTLVQVCEAMLRVLEEESTNHYRLGQLYNYAEQRGLAKAAGYESTQDYFRQHIRQVSPSTLFAYGAVANAFRESSCQQFGVTRLSLLLTYKKAAKITLNHDEPGGTFIEVPGKKGVVTPRLFSECTVDELRKAIQNKRQPTSATTPLLPEDVALADRYIGAVTALFKKGDPIRVQVRSHEGTAVLNIDYIPLAHVRKVAEALLTLPPPVQEVREEETAPQVM